MQNPTSSNKSKPGLFCTNCMKTSHTKDRCYYLIGFPRCKHCNVKGHTKRRCRYLNGRTDSARNQMRRSRSYSKQGREETDVRTVQKPNQKHVSILSKGKTQACAAEHAKGSNSALLSSSRSKEVSKDNLDSVALETILPDDLIAKIFSFLPMASIIRATAVCKRWHDAVLARKQDSWIGMRVQKPWFYMFDYNHPMSASYSYDPTIQTWYRSLFPFTLLQHLGIISSSHGLLCFMDFANYRVLIHNPITKEAKQLPQLESVGPNEYYKALSLSVHQMSPHSYTVVAVKMSYGKYSYESSELTIQIYKSESKMWVTRARENLKGWDGSNECVVCDKVFYYLIHSCDVLNPQVGLIMHDLSTSGEASTSLMSTLILLPTSPSWATLTNMNDRVIVVGGNTIGHEKVCIWELHKRSVWEEIGQVPNELIRRYFEFSYSYKCCGAEGLIYIHDLDYPILLTFDMETKQWEWTTRFPMPKKSIYRSYYAFCFEPRLDVSP